MRVTKILPAIATSAVLPPAAGFGVCVLHSGGLREVFRSPFFAGRGPPYTRTGNVDSRRTQFGSGRGASDLASAPHPAQAVVRVPVFRCGSGSRAPETSASDRVCSLVCFRTSNPPCLKRRRGPPPSGNCRSVSMRTYSIGSRVKAGATRRALTEFCAS
jgi:hypothetical protein